MTTLQIIPKLKDKTARFKGAVAAGEHVAVTIEGAADWLGEDEGANLTLRVIDETTRRTVAVFPRPAEVLDDGEEPDEWGTDDGDLTCTLDLNTVQAVNAARHMLRVPVLFVLGDTDDPRTLYFKDRHLLEYWPERIGDDAPYDLGRWPMQIEEWESQIGNMTLSAERVEGGVAVTAWDGKGERPAPVVVRDGAKGDTGPQGPRGPAGADGADGKDGVDGKDGADGQDATVDSTLTQQGAAADAKKVGDELSKKRGNNDIKVSFVYAPWFYGEYGYLDFDYDAYEASIAAGEDAKISWGNVDSLYIEYEYANSRWRIVSVEDEVDEYVSAAPDVLSLTSAGMGTTFVRPFVLARRDTLALQGPVDAALALKADKSEMSVTPGTGADEDKTTIQLKSGTGATVLAKHQDISGKADTTDLPYRLVEPGEWEFSNGQSYVIGGPEEDQDGWVYSVQELGHSQYFTSEADALAALSLTFDGDVPVVTATRPSLPGHLCDRAGNRVVVSGDTTITLPAAVPGYLRDFLVRLEISGSTVPTITFAAPTGETITYETDGDEFPVPDEAGTWLYSFTESCAAHKFAVSLKKVTTVAQGGS